VEKGVAHEQFFTRDAVQLLISKRKKIYRFNELIEEEGPLARLSERTVMQ
jgi:hypothetical protein